MASSPCLNCLERRVGCHSTCANYIALCEENKAKKEYLKDGKDVCSFLKAGYLKRIKNEQGIAELEEPSIVSDLQIE